MERLTKEDIIYLNRLKEILYRVNKGQIDLNIVDNEIDISSELKR